MGTQGEQELEVWVKCKVERRAGVLVSRLRNPTSSAVKYRSPPHPLLLSILGEPGPQELREFVMQTHTGKVVMRDS